MLNSYIDRHERATADMVVRPTLCDRGLPLALLAMVDRTSVNHVSDAIGDNIP
jgi:hypothetical protein